MVAARYCGDRFKWKDLVVLGGLLHLPSVPECHILPVTLLPVQVYLSANHIMKILQLLLFLLRQQHAVIHL